MRFPTSSVEATVHCLVLASLFVVSLYAWNLTGRPQYDRNHPIQVKRRLKSVAAACFLSPIYLIFVSTRSSFESDQPSPTLATWLGLSTSKLIESVVLSLFLTATAFLGPLCLEDKLPTPSNLRRIQLSQFSDIFFLRNVIVAPIAEEFVYRGCLVPLLWSAGFTFNQIVFWCPLFFGVAHLHHILQNISHGWNALKIAILQALFQTLYTWVFGMYSTFLFLRTGNIAAPIVAHSFCNFMGFPPLHEIPQHPQRSRIIASFLVGLGVFAILVMPLTDATIFTPNLYAYRL